ncbi:MAG TPA: MarC family protein [Casimicrobiaceae bacterium]|nr:MarC family protein [Casimicrobiaceae bacterium]
MPDDILSAGFLLLLVLDPFGNMPIVLSALAQVPRERHRRIIVRECLFAYGILLAFMAGGKAFLDFLQLSETSLAIAGGIVLFLIALRMIFPRPEGVFGDPPGTEPFLVPLAVPAIAGPSAVATVMLMASRDPSQVAHWVVALTAAMVVTLVVLLGAQRLERLLGERGVRAIERLTGLLLTAIAVQMLLDGITTFVRQLSA